jgi:VWFA-related protein
MLPRNSLASIHQFGLVLLLFSCLGASTILSAQQPEQPALPSAEDTSRAPALHVSARLVQLNVIVNDKHGNPIAGLSQKDFSIVDNGQSQEIRVFNAETSRPSNLSRTPLPPDTHTNRPEEQINLPASVTVILLDALNTESADQALARKQVIDVLREIQPQEYVALYWLGNGLQILHDFTTDASSLRQVLAGYESKSSRQLDNSALADPSLDTPNPSTSSGQTYERQAFRLAFDQRVANQSTRDRVRSTVAALVAIANHLGTRKGRKSLVWVSSSFPINLGYDKFDLNWTNDTGENFANDVRRAARALSDADIAVYPVDARGLLGSTTSANQDDLDAHIGDPTDTDVHLPTRAAPETFDTMRLLAERTGGRAYYGTNDISGAIRRAMNDSRVTYTLAYYPAIVKWDGSFHELKVKVGIPGVEVRARSGYFALPEAPMAPPKSDRRLIAQLASSRLPARGIGLHVSAQTSSASGGSALITQVHINLRDIQMQDKAGRRTGTVQSIFLQMDNAGRILHVDDRTFHPDFDATTYQRGLLSGITDTRELHVVPDAAQLCIVVRDAANANLGSIYLPLAEYITDQLKARRSKQ